MFTGDEGGRAATLLFGMLGLAVIAVVAWRWAAQPGVSRLNARFLGGVAFGLVALGFAVAAFAGLVDLAQNQRTYLPREITMLAPVQQAGSSMRVEVANLAEQPSLLGASALAWPALLGLACWVYAWFSGPKPTRALCGTLGWLLLSWGALRCPNGTAAFLMIIGVFLLWHVVVPSLRQLWRTPSQAPGDAPAGAQPAAASTASALLILGLSWLVSGCASTAAERSSTNSITSTNIAISAESVVQDIRIEDKFV